MSGWTRGSLSTALKAAGVASILGWVVVLSAGPALADPDPAPGDPGVVAGPAVGQDPTPFTGTVPFGPPRFVPANGSTGGVAQPIIINFPGPVDAGGTVSSFHTGDTLVATADDATHQLTVTRNGTVEKTIPMSMGMAAGGHQTANGTYHVQERKTPGGGG